MMARFRRLLIQRKWLTFVLMGLFFFLFGAFSLNLVYLFRANIGLFLDNGIVMVVRDGGLQQLIELLVSALLSMVFYLLFKSCEYVLVHWVTDPVMAPDPDAHPEKSKN